MRKTKIIATIGPASRDAETLDQLIAAGMDCARLNFSHGTLEEHDEVIRTVRELSEKHQRQVAILQDLGGIKLRLGTMKEAVRLNRGDEVFIVADEYSDRPDVLPFLNQASYGTSGRATWCSYLTGPFAWKFRKFKTWRPRRGCAMEAPFRRTRE